MQPLIVIPARMDSSRLPGKPLADIGGKPMIVRVCELAKMADIGPVLVAAAEDDIASATREAGYDSVLTDPGLPSGSDRVHAAADLYDSAGKYDVVINLQGDMPSLHPSALASVLTPLESDMACDLATLTCEITDPAERTDPNVVKLVMAGRDTDRIRRALYFTRTEAPYGPGPLWHHVGVYAWRRESLRRFVAADPSILEKRERLEQLRALELGMRIDCAVISGPPPNGVDTPEDLAAARMLLAGEGK